MILVNLGGGLGNQMFRYAAAWALQKKTGEALYVSMKGLDSGERAYSLDAFCLPPVKRCNVILELFIREYMKLKYILSGLNSDRYDDCIKLFEMGYCKTKRRQFFRIGEHSFIKFLDGDFQSEEFFFEYRNEIKTLFRIKDDLSINNQEKLEHISKISDSVCVHVRLGDYLLERYKRFNVCTKEYYKNAILKMEEKLDSPVFFVFSENIDIVKQWNLPGEIRYIEPGETDYEDLQLMKTCKHFIISNSTFSWWAQYLSANEDKIVIAPNKWFNGEDMNPTCLYMQDWILEEC